MSKLYIAEKPSLAKVIATGLGGIKSKFSGYYITESNDTVTWCFGHLYEQAEPQDYDDTYKVWSLEDLPIVPVEWELKAKEDAKSQIKVIAGLLSKANCVVNAGDPDREGQLLVDEVIEKQNYQGNVERVWLQDLTETGVKFAIKNIKSNKEAIYTGLSLSAKARSRADWLMGMNLTRACTLVVREQGGQGVVSVGRVQTPTLALVVQRDLEIDQFKSIPFFGIQVLWDKGFESVWKPNEDIADSEGRCLDKVKALAVASKLKGKNGLVDSVERKQTKSKPPMPYSLSELQGDANKKYGFSAQKVLDIAQSLYETHKITSYPRTDSGYLSEAQHSEASNILQTIRKESPNYAGLIDNAEMNRKSSAFNDKKVTAHTGIIPTNTSIKLDKLSKDEASLYDMIVLRYIAQFYPDAEFDITKVIIRIEDERFTSSGKIILKEGWRVCYQDNSIAQEDKIQNIPELTKGQKLVCSEAKLEEKKTTPPARFTEGSLITAMAKIARCVQNEKLKKILKDNSGIGTEATRAGIIETLKSRGFLETKGKTLLSTSKGRSLIKSLPEDIVSADMTAYWELRLEEIANGNLSLDEFIIKQEDFVKNLVSNLCEDKNFGSSMSADIPDCPKCQNSRLKQITAKKNGKKYWVCASGKETCDAFYSDKSGKPNFAPKKKFFKKKKR